MLTGYAQGAFPMARSADDPRLEWFDPPVRGVLPVGGLRLSASMRRHLRRCGWTPVLNRDFAASVRLCANRDETWINEPLRELYQELHERGHAHALEMMDAEGATAGAVFGVTLGAAFFGESMVSIRDNGSKTALAVLSVHLARCGFRLFDTQYPSAHLRSLGGRSISRPAYLRQLRAALSRGADITALPLPPPHSVTQAMTQTS